MYREVLLKCEISMWMFYIKNHRNSSEINLKLNIENSIGFVETFKYGNPYFWVVVCYVFRETYFINDYMNKPWNVTLFKRQTSFFSYFKDRFLCFGDFKCSAYSLTSNRMKWVQTIVRRLYQQTFHWKVVWRIFDVPALRIFQNWAFDNLAANDLVVIIEFRHS